MKIKETTNDEKCIDVIKKYLADKNYNQALLVDGPWGCGKSFFIDNNIKKIFSGDTRVIKISLYGMDTIEAVQNAVYTNVLGKIIKGNRERNSQVRDFFAKQAPIFGLSAIKDIFKYMGVEATSEELKNESYKKIFSTKRKNMVFIFDDFERSRINIFELMGYINNISENMGYKVIIIANESEVHRSENDIASAIHEWISLADLQYNDVKKYEKEEDIIQFRNVLENRKKTLFDLEKTYEKTREKLIGITLSYQADINEVFDDIVKRIISKDDIKKLVQNNKDSIISYFIEKYKGNLRTFISFLIATENIVSEIDIADGDDEEIITNEKNRILDYILFTAAKKANGEELIEWKTPGCGPFNESYGLIGKFGYSFVDDYWKNYIVDKKIVNEIFRDQVRIHISQKEQKNSEDSYYELSLFKLKKWYLLDDVQVEKYVKELKKELEKKKYRKEDFSEILTILININNPKYGIQSDRNDTDESWAVMYDTINDDATSGDLINEVEEILKSEEEQSKWYRASIEEFVELMVEQSDGLRLYQLNNKTNDIKFAKIYNYYAEPIVNKILKSSVKEQLENANTLKIDQLNDEFIRICEEKKNVFWSLRRFLSLYEQNYIVNILKQATARGIYIFDEGLKKIYDDIGGLKCFEHDRIITQSIRDMLRSDREGDCDLFNKNNARNKAIALYQLEQTFSQLLNE